MLSSVIAAADAELDLRGVACPLNWARARVRLDGMRSGQRLVLLLDDRKALRDIPPAAEAAGYAAVEVLQCADWWRLVIEV